MGGDEQRRGRSGRDDGGSGAAAGRSESGDVGAAGQRDRRDGAAQSLFLGRAESVLHARACDGKGGGAGEEGEAGAGFDRSCESGGAGSGKRGRQAAGHREPGENRGAPRRAVGRSVQDYGGAERHQDEGSRGGGERADGIEHLGGIYRNARGRGGGGRRGDVGARSDAGVEGAEEERAGSGGDPSTHDGG